MLDFTRRNRDKITCMNISRHLVKYVEESPDQVLGQIACPTRINCVLYKKYPAEKLPQYVERFLPYGIPIQFRYDYTETTPENLYDQDHDPILQDLKRLFTYRGLDGCRMRNGFHFEYKGLHMTYHKTLPYSTIVEKGDDGVTYDILYDILIKQNGEIHSDWTGVKMDVEKYRRVTFEPTICGCWTALLISEKSLLTVPGQEGFFIGCTGGAGPPAACHCPPYCGRPGAGTAARPA